MRHDMAGGLQPVMMLATIVEKRLLSPTPDIQTLAKNCHEMRSLAIDATHTSLDVIAWMTPEADARVALGKGISDATHLLATELSFRGFKFENLTETEAIEVRLDHLRGFFMSALLALTDASPAPATIRITAAQDGDNMLVSLLLTDIKSPLKPALGTSLGESSPNEELQIGLAAYRKIDWNDVQAIAEVDGLSVNHEAASVMLRLPLPTT